MNGYVGFQQGNWAQTSREVTFSSIITDAKQRIREIDAAIDRVGALTAERDALKAIIRAAEEATAAELTR